MSGHVSRQAKRCLTISARLVGLIAILSVSMPALAATRQSTEESGQRKSSPTEQELERRLDDLTAQNKALMAKLERLEANQAKLGAQIQQQAQSARDLSAKTNPPVEAHEGSREPAGGPEVALIPDPQAGTVISSYGEIGYSHPTKSPQDTNVDVGRAVIGLQHRFDDKTKMVSEFEWEHAITSSGDRGEAEVEQLWVERELNPNMRARAGLFLMPVGLINQNHEPTAYYGVFRPDVDTKIVPSTWREVGIGLSGNVSNGLNWDIALTTAPDISKWDPTSIEGRTRGPLQAIHGEGQFAAARDLGLVGALNWRAPGLLIGGSLVYDSIGQHKPEFAASGSKLLMLDLHTRYQAAGWDLAGEFVRGTISQTEALNTGFLNGGVSDPTLVPHLFYGGYVQAAYRAWASGDYTLSPFIRYEILNTAANFGSLSVTGSPMEHVTIIGANLTIGEGVVLKADYRAYGQNKLPDSSNHFNLGNSFNIGVGYSF